MATISTKRETVGINWDLDKSAHAVVKRHKARVYIRTGRDLTLEEAAADLLNNHVNEEEVEAKLTNQ